MQTACSRALKEWDIACCALIAGKQTILIRKGGIREDGGIFAIDDSNFWLMPTFDHQSADLLQPIYASEICNSSNSAPHEISIQGYAVVDQVWVAKNDDQINALKPEMVWNEEYVKLRFDYNPYDPLYILMLRVHRLPEPVVLPMIKSYGGCKSWVTLDRAIQTAGATPAISDDEFAARRNRVIALMDDRNPAP